MKKGANTVIYVTNVDCMVLVLHVGKLTTWRAE